MPFNTGIAGVSHGLPGNDSNTYCQNDTAASDYGKCYNVVWGKAVFVQTDTTTWPIDPTTGDSFPCAKDGTCTRYTATTSSSRYLATLFSFTGKQAIVQYIYTRSHSVLNNYGRIVYLWGHPIPTTTGDGAYSFLFPVQVYEQVTWPIYDPVANWKAHLNPYTISIGHVFYLRWQGTLFTPVLYLHAYEGNLNNIWYASLVKVVYAYESSPLAVVPLDYDRDYVQYQELRSAFGFSINGVDQPGWNADDIIRVLKELFPSRAWAVFDDRQYVLYLYNLTPDYVPDWLVEKLSPTAMKVLQSPADATVAKAWLDLLNERNAQIPPQAELP
jgi:hypothetical protein